MYSWDFVVLNLIFVEVGDVVDDHPWKGPAEIDEFVHHEGHDASGEHIVLNVGVPRSPHAFEDV